MSERRLLRSNQASAQIRLIRAIRDAVDHQLTIPCQFEPSRWDDPVHGSPQWCNLCPVLTICGAYADTKPIKEGILAGRRYFANAHQREQCEAAEQTVNSISTSS